MTANTTKSRKGKARALQNAVVEDLRANIPPLGSADISPAIMGSSGMDILLSTRARDLFPYAVECKNQEALNIWDALKQCQGNAAKESLIPLLVFKRARSETYAVLRWEDYLALVRKVRR